MTTLGSLKLLKLIGYEVIKANSEQVALNNKENTMPAVFINDIGYLSPQPHIWFNIDDEIKRLENEAAA